MSYLESLKREASISPGARETLGTDPEVITGYGHEANGIRAESALKKWEQAKPGRWWFIRQEFTHERGGLGNIVSLSVIWTLSMSGPGGEDARRITGRPTDVLARLVTLGIA